MITNFIQLDFNKENDLKVPSVQYDSGSRFVKIKLQQNKVPFEINGYRVTVVANKVDGTEIMNDCTILDGANGLVQFEITEQFNAVEGVVDCQLKLFKGKTLLTSMPFSINVVKSVSTKEIVSSNELKTLVNALGEVQNIDNRFAQTNNQISELANKGTTVEVLERVTKEEIDRQIADGTIANLTIADNSIENNKYKDKSISVEKTDFISLGKNILNLKQNFTQGARVRQTSGEVVIDSPTTVVTDFIKVDSNNRTLCINSAFTGLTNVQCAGYDSNYSFVAGGVTVNDRVLTTINKVSFIRLTIPSVTLSNATLCYGSEPTDEKYKLISDVLEVNKSKVSDIANQCENSTYSNFSFLDINKDYKNLMIDSNKKEKWSLGNCTISDTNGYFTINGSGECNIEFICNIEDLKDAYTMSFALQNSVNVKSINPIMRAYKKSGGYTNIYYNSTPEVNVADISDIFKTYAFKNNVSVPSDTYEIRFRFIVSFDSAGGSLDFTNAMIIPNSISKDVIDFVGGFWNDDLITVSKSLYSAESEFSKKSLYSETSNYINTNYDNKIMDTLGDSITARGEYQKYIKQKIKFKEVLNHGIGTTTIAGTHTNAMWKNHRIDSLDKNADVILFTGGTNDWQTSIPLGDFNSTDAETNFYGGCRVTIEKLLNKYPTKRIIVATPIWGISPICSDGIHNTHNLTIFDYANALKEVAESYCIPVVDLTKNWGVNNINKDNYFGDVSATVSGDYIHPNVKGHKRIAELIIGKLKEIESI